MEDTYDREKKSLYQDYAKAQKNDAASAPKSNGNSSYDGGRHCFGG
jgi:hypothetical protein